MKFQIKDKGIFPQNEKNLFLMTRDNWDDFSFKTTFDTFYYDATGNRVQIGSVKIGYFGMESSTRVYDSIPKEFSTLPDNYFSLGQSEEYYERIANLGDELRCEILSSLRDIAFETELYERVKNEAVTRQSLMRDISKFSLKYQLNRMANGGARLTNYGFSYSTPEPKKENDISSITLDFSVSPGSNPPTNIHVLIGRNGTGKTHLIQNMINSIQLDDPGFGVFQYDDKQINTRNSERFANILCVAFSPFDDFSNTFFDEKKIPYTYIGLEKESSNLFEAIENQFWEALSACMSNPHKKQRWLNTIEILKSDPTFSESQIEYFAAGFQDSKTIDENVEPTIKKVFSRLSSGHKVTLLIITCCVNNLEERSIVFLDEPENHLHPPLLSAFIRAFSYLLIDRNGVAVVSTHSPVVLQEVPRSCVWALRRNGRNLTSERLPIETFGSSIGLLTNQVFGLEVTESGFHKLLSNAVLHSSDYDSILESFEGKLGDEAKGILRTLLAIKKHGGTIS